MSTLRRNWFLLLVLLLASAPLLLLWRTLSTTSITDLWTDSANRTDFVINIAASVAFELGVGILFLFRKSITRWILALLLRGRSLQEERERVEQERLYLENLIERFRREFPWEVDKYTDLEAVQEDLEEQARRVQPRLWKLPDLDETRFDGRLRSRVNVQHFLRKEKDPIMLKGDPGTGKTLTVRRFAVDQAKRALTNLPGEVQIPVYISLAIYTGSTETGEPEPVYDFLQRYLAEEYPAATYLRELLREYLVQGRLLLLFDGLNELPPDEYIPRYKKLEEFILRRYPRNKAVFTCRTLRHTSLSHFKTVAISDLDDDQIRRFIAAYRGEKATEALYQDLTTGDGFMLRVCRNPFMLQMLVRRDPARPAPQSPAQLFAEYVHDQLASYSECAERTAEVLRQIAFAMQQDGIFAGVVARGWIETKLPDLDLDNHLKIARQAQLIDYTPERKLRFYHQILQEYFSAVALRNDWQAGKSLDLYFADYRWEETILVCAGIVEDTEAFIRRIWSRDDDSPENFWLATKAVGSSGKCVGEEYYEALIRKAEQYLNLRKGSKSDGYSTLVLAVETVKALSYIDDAQIAELLSLTLVRHDGWLQELCIQVLGSSRYPLAHSLLRSAVVELRSARTLFLIAPYCDAREWLQLAAKSALSIAVLINTFWRLLRWLWILTPAILLGLLYTGARFFKVNPIILTGRLLSIFFLLEYLLVNLGELSAIIRRREGARDKMKRLRAWFTWADAVRLAMSAVLWFFSGEALSLGAVLLYFGVYAYTVFVGITAIRKLGRPADSASYLYRQGRFAMFVVLVFGVTRLLGLLFPFLRQSPSAPELPRNISAMERILDRLLLALTHPLVWTLWFVLATLIGLSSAVVHLRTFLAYWRMQRYRKAFINSGEAWAVQRIADIVLNTSEWPHVREKAIRDLRLIETPSDYIEDLERLIEKEPSLRRELERTVYELRARARERERVVPSA